MSFGLSWSAPELFTVSTVKSFVTAPRGLIATGPLTPRHCQRPQSHFNLLHRLFRRQAAKRWTFPRSFTNAGNHPLPDAHVHVEMIRHAPRQRRFGVAGRRTTTKGAQSPVRPASGACTPSYASFRVLPWLTFDNLCRWRGSVKVTRDTKPLLHRWGQESGIVHANQVHTPQVSHHSS